MGLDCDASIYRKRIFITDEIRQKFVDEKISLCYDDGSSFRGKSHDIIIDSITDHSLYSFLSPYSIEKIYRELCYFIENNQEKLQKDEEEKEEIDIRDYVKDYRESKNEYYMTSLPNLIGLKNFFKICYENQLYLHPSS